MIQCEKCGRLLSENVRFCGFCGAQIIHTAQDKSRKCSRCGNEIEDGTSFCAECGMRLDLTERRSDERQNSITKLTEINQEKKSKGFFISEYIEKILLLEKSIYTQDQTISQVVEHANSLGLRNSYAKPEKPDYVSKLDSDSGMKTLLQTAWTGAVIGGIVGIFGVGILPGAMIGALILAGGMFACTAISDASHNKRLDENYNERLALYQMLVTEDKQRVEVELLEQKKLLDILEEMKVKREETATILSEYYEKNLIFPKYRNLVAICSFFEYFSSGRCSELTGHEGAYNIYENELRLERICTKLDEVIQNLEKIRINQYFLYEAIQEGNRISEQLLQESLRQSQLTEEVLENSRIAAHYAEITANNTEASAWIGVATYLSIEEAKK